MFVLICAVLASLAVGVLMAYALCVAMFGLFKIQAVKAVAARQALAAAATAHTPVQALSN